MSIICLGIHVAPPLFVETQLPHVHKIAMAVGCSLRLNSIPLARDDAPKEAKAHAVI